MSRAERTLILETVARWPDPPTLTFEDAPEQGAVNLKAAPCPLLGRDHTCRVYDVRPMVCRRFCCGRVNAAAEPFEPEVYAPDLGLLGCRNLSDRVRESPRFAQHVQTIERHAMRWGRDHGWRCR